MSQPPPQTARQRTDTPPESPPLSTDEMPPYGQASRWRIALAAGAVLAALVLAGWVAWRLARGAYRWLAVEAPRDEVIMFPVSDQPYSGTRYRVEFFDGEYRQLHDLDLSIVLLDLHGPAADAALDVCARRYAAEVDARGSERCFKPRLVVYGVDGRPARTWQVAA